MQNEINFVQFYQQSDQNFELTNFQDLNLIKYQSSEKLNSKSQLNINPNMPSNIEIQKILDLYKSGRYQCDVWFYENLILLVNELEIFESIPSLQRNLKHVKKIHQLTLQNSDSLNEEFDQEKAIQNTQEIKRQIHMINAKQVIEIVSHVQKQGFKSYSQHCAQLIKKYNYHPKYVDVVKNIISTVYDPKLKAEYILISTLFMIRNTDKIQDILSIYDKAIQNGLVLMKQLRKKLPQCKVLIDSMNDKLDELFGLEEEGKLQKSEDKMMSKLLECQSKIVEYLQGSYFIYNTLHKICDIAKILQQKNNFTLKLNSFKPDIEKTLNLLKETNTEETHDPLEVQGRMSDLPIQELKGMFLGQKSGVQKINRCCKICLRYVEKEDGLNGSGDYHKVCQQVIKQLMMSSNQTRQ